MLVLSGFLLLLLFLLLECMFSLKAWAGLWMWTAMGRFPGLVEMKRCIFFGELHCSCSCVHFTPIVWFFTKSKQSSSIPEDKEQTVVGGRNIYKIVNLSPSPVCSPCRSSPLREWPITSRLTADSDGPDFSYLTQPHFQILSSWLQHLVFLAL